MNKTQKTFTLRVVISTGHIPSILFTARVIVRMPRLQRKVRLLNQILKVFFINFRDRWQESRHELETRVWSKVSENLCVGKGLCRI